MSGKPILVLDFDGVVHSYSSGWYGPRTIPDPPNPGAIMFLLRALQKFDVVIFSSRGRYLGGRWAMRRWLKRHAGVFWWDAPEQLGLERVRFPRHKPPALVSIDDRAITFTGEWPKLDLISEFKPWNRSRSLMRLSSAAQEVLETLSRSAS